MAGREERAERAPRPEREHPVGQALYALNRNGFGVYHARCIAINPTPEDKEHEKRMLIAQLDAVKAQIQAL
jgi:hypothetical protein